jgi:hypothetical protein
MAVPHGVGGSRLDRAELPLAVHLLRQETLVLTALPEHAGAPRVLGRYDDGDRVALGELVVPVAEVAAEPATAACLSVRQGSAGVGLATRADLRPLTRATSRK